MTLGVAFPVSPVVKDLSELVSSEKSVNNPRLLVNISKVPRHKLFTCLFYIHFFTVTEETCVIRLDSPSRDPERVRLSDPFIIMYPEGWVDSLVCVFTVVSYFDVVFSSLSCTGPGPFGGVHGND